MLTQPPPAPRAVPIGTMSWNAGFLLLFGAIWAVVGLVMSAVFTASGGPVWDDWILDSRSEPAQATPVSAKATHTRVNRKLMYEIRYRFTDRRGKTWTTASDTTSAALISAAQAGKSIAIEYDPEDPERARPVGESASVMGRAVFLPLGAGLIGAALAAAGLLSALRTRRIYRNGQATRARVTELVATSSRQNRSPVMRMTYVFPTLNGPLEAQWKTAHPQPIDTMIWVLVDEQDPTRNIPAVT